MSGFGEIASEARWPQMFDFGTSRHFAALQNLVAIGGIADIEQAAPIKLDLSARALNKERRQFGRDGFPLAGGTVATHRRENIVKKPSKTAA